MVSKCQGSFFPQRTAPPPASGTSCCFPFPVMAPWRPSYILETPQERVDRDLSRKHCTFLIFFIVLVLHWEKYVYSLLKCYTTTYLKKKSKDTDFQRLMRVVLYVVKIKENSPLAFQEHWGLSGHSHKQRAGTPQSVSFPQYTCIG